LDEPQTPTPSVKISYEREWKDFVNVNGGAMFQTALLLCGDAHLAEDAVIASLEELDVSMPPEKEDPTAWQRAVVIRSVRTADWLSAADPGTLSVIQPGLWPVMQITGRSRICFVLQMLLGYAAASCAQMLNIDESKTPALLNEAVTHLQNSFRNWSETSGPGVLASHIHIPAL
jgi:hypothetical protein